MKKLPLYLIFLWTFIHIGRPQDVFPALKLINPGDVVAILTLVSYIFVEKKNLRVFSFPEFRLLLLLFAVAVLSTPYGFYPKASLSFLYNFYFKIGLYLYLVAKLVTDEEQIQSMIKTVMLSGFLMAVAAVSSQQIGIRTGIGTTYDPNDLGMLFVVTLPLALFQGMTSTNRRWKIICYTGAVFNLLAVISTQSRGAYLGLVAVGGFVLISKVRGLSKKRVIALSALIGVVFILSMTAAFKERMDTIFEDISSMEAGSGCILVWNRALAMAWDHPLLGVGPDAFVTAYGYYLDHDMFGGVIAREKFIGWRTAHNSFLLILVEMGIIGFVVFLGIIIRSFRNLRRIKFLSLAGNIPPRFSNQAICITLAMVGWLVCAFFLSQSYDPTIYLFSLLSGAMVRNILQETKKLQNQAAVKPGMLK